MGLFSALGSAALGMVDTVTNNYFNKKAASKQNAYQWDFWHANNDYNSPKSQMQRLEEAGLNPNLVYGNGGATHQATMATAPKVNPTQSNILGSLQAFNQMENTRENTKHVASQNKIIKYNLKYAEDNNLPYGVPLNASTTTGGLISSGLSSVREVLANLIADVFSSEPPLNPYETKSGLRRYDPTKPAIGRNVDRKRSNFKLRFW